MPKRHKTSHNSLQVRLDDLLEYEPITKNQELTYEAWNSDYNLVLTGSAGTGKTFMGMYLGLEQVLDPDTEQDRLVIIRSMVPTRDMGFLPGSKEEKEDAFTSPYKNIANELFGDNNSWNKAVSAKRIMFESTSFIRGLTLDYSVILVDEMLQSDFKYSDDKEGIIKFLTIVEQLKKFEIINFGWEDIVRSDFVRDYIMTKEMLGIES